MALQTSPRVQTSIPPDAFPLDAPPVRHAYSQPQSPILGDDRSGTSSRPSSRKPSRRPSGGGSQPATPHVQPRSPNPNLGSSGGTVRANVTQTSPRTPTAAAAGGFQSREQYEAAPASAGEIVSPPPRTSSHQRPITAGPGDFSLPVRSHNAVQPGENYGSAQYETSSRPAEATSTSTRSPREPSSGRSQHVSLPAPDTRRQASSQARGERVRAPEQRPADVSRGNSEIINRVVVTDPQEDIRREKERLAESVPVREDGRVPTTPGEVESPRDNSRPQRSRQDFSGSASRRKETKFGEYVLGQTLGEGEFGKVKLGWKKDGSVEVAIKLIRRENLNTNPSRLPKIYREISILRGLSHPNIVRLHEMVETERQIGIILEYASGGELFDYILNHRYLKDNAARRLFAQLVSGVGYLHKKGIVHRDLKLENLLLDRNRNIIITDFGFANTFDPRDELAEEIEYNLTNREFVKSHNLERVVNGHRRGDLMQTSCGSPCYAAPELVVTDSLYTGRKVDVWSCGVILYAMLAGYLPFDDDPANPEGDNINLLYKYIVSTPLTFPEYVSPHARDLLRRILVPDPRKRADLFEVARHSWLSDYAHVVAHVTSSTTTIGDLTNDNVVQDIGEPPSLTRSASVREPSKPHSSSMAVGGSTGKTSKNDESEKGKASRDAKRRTVQVEYVAPQSQTVRGEASPPPAQPSFSRPTDPSRRSAAKTGATGSGQPQSPYDESRSAATNSRRATQQTGGQMDPPSSRGGREGPRAVSDSAHAFGQYPATSITRPTTGGSMSSSGGGRLPSRGNSYGQPVAPTLAPTNVQGSLAQPKSGSRNYNISAPIPHQQPEIPDNIGGRPVSQRVPSNRNSGVPSTMSENKGHKRANTFGNVFGRSGSLFGGRSQPQSPAEASRPDRKHPPTSMRVPMSADSPRQSSDSHRPSFSFSRKNSDLTKSEKGDKPEKPRRFSLLPASFSLKALTGGSKEPAPEMPKQSQDQRPSTSQPMKYSYTNPPTRNGESQRYEVVRDGTRHVSAPQQNSVTRPPRSAPYARSDQYSQWQPGTPGLAYPLGEPAPTESDASFAQYQPQQVNQQPRYPQGFNDTEQEPQPRPSMQQSRGAKLHKPNRKFNDAWEQEHDASHHSGSTGAARRVMDFFRRRGKARSGDDR